MDKENPFDKYSDEYLHFERVEKKRSNRPDMHAFLLLNQIVPGTRDMISAAEHDEIYLSIDVDDLLAIASDAQILELVRCGVRLDEEYGLCMFV